MPPKKQNGPSKKADKARKEQLVEDKTFGLKNKNKSSKVQKFVQEVENQVKGANTRADRMKAEQTAKARKAKEAEEALKNLFVASITQPKVPPGVDPKSIVCEFFKAGVCTKGTRCKFAHDLNVAKKANKIDLYADARDEDTIDSWDQSKLEEVVAEKHGKGVVTTTDIVCKFFLDAIEKSLYGWFWVCPNGGKACKYRHALPSGYVYKSKKDREAEKEKKVEDVTIEEIIEEQRAKLGAKGGTPVTAETLAAYKKEKQARIKKEEEKKQKELMKKTGGRSIMSGRALFTFDPTLFRDDADADEDSYSVHSLNDPDESDDEDGDDANDDEDEDDGDDANDQDEEEKPSADVDADADAAVEVLDKSLYLQDVDDLDALKE